MNVYYANCPIPADNVRDCALHFFSSLQVFIDSMKMLTQHTNHELPIEPGSALFLLGGRQSLLDALNDGVIREFKAETTDGMGLGVALKTAFHVADTGGRVKSTLKNIFRKKAKTLKPVGMGITNGRLDNQEGWNNYKIAQTKEVYNKFVKKTLSMIVVFNTNTEGLELNQDEVKRRQINPVTTLGQVRGILSEYLVERIQQKHEDRMRIINEDLF